MVAAFVATPMIWKYIKYVALIGALPVLMISRYSFLTAHLTFHHLRSSHEDQALIFVISKFLTSVSICFLIQYLVTEKIMGHWEYDLKHSGCNKRKVFRLLSY